jgi:hypothetical protein
LRTAPCVLQLLDGRGLKTIRPSRFRLFPFRSPLLRESHSISFPQGTKMSQFSWFPLVKSSLSLSKMVAQLGNPRLGSLDNSPRLIAVLPRPSSAVDAKASTLCPFFFNLHQPEQITKRPNLFVCFFNLLYSLFKVQTPWCITKASNAQYTN